MRRGLCLTAIFPDAMFDKDKLLEVIQKTAKTGFYNGIEYYFEGSNDDYNEIKEQIQKLDLYSVFLAGYPMKNEKVDISSKNEKIRKNSVDYCKTFVERAAMLGCDKVLLLSGPVWEERDDTAFIQQLSKSLYELEDAQSAQEIAPEIMLEFFNTHGEPYLAFGEFETIRSFCNQLADGNFGITYDFSHAAQLGMDIATTVKELLPWIHHIHIANSVSKVKTSPFYGDKHPLFGVEHEDLRLEEVKELLEYFQKEGYLKDVSICSMEMIAREDHSNEWYFEQTLKQARILLEGKAWN